MNNYNIANANLNTRQRRSPTRKAWEFPCSLSSHVWARPLISCCKINIIPGLYFPIDHRRQQTLYFGKVKIDGDLLACKVFLGVCV